MTVRAVVFDLGGVIVRTEDQEPRIKWEERLHLGRWGLAELVFGCDASLRASVGDLTDADVWSHVKETLGLDEAQLAELRRDFWAGDRVDQELVQFIRQLRPRVKTAILSNAWPGARQMITGPFGLGDVVDLVMISAEEGLAKPDPRIYTLLVDRLGLRPAEVLFVDDMEENVLGARAVGMQAVQFKNRQQVIQEIERAVVRPMGD